jgi:exo beta-1,2-glucooligosaccharide sophorohydrolase (non-reducing end)
LKYLIVNIFLLVSLKLVAQEPAYDIVFFSNSRMSGNYFYSEANYSGTSWIKNLKNKLPVADSIFFTPGNSLQLTYTNGVDGKWKASVYRHEVRGQDHLAEGKALTFKIYIASPGTRPVDLPAVQLGFGDSSLTEAAPLTGVFEDLPTNKWLTAYLAFDQFKGFGNRKSSEIQSVHFIQNASDGQRHEIYVDQLELFYSLQVKPSLSAPAMQQPVGYALHVDLKWQPVTNSGIKYVKIYRSEDGKNFQPVGIQIPMINRYADFTGKTGKKYWYKASFLDRHYSESPASKIVTADTWPMDEEQVLDMVQEANFRYYWEANEKVSGLSRENIPGRHNMVAIGASGFGMMALIAGTERKFITRQQAVLRFTRIVNFLSRAETHHGAFPHFMDGPTAKTEPFFGRRDNGGDLVETSFLVQGLLAARAYFSKNDPAEKNIRDKITSIWKKIEWDWYRRYPDSKYLYWHWSPDQNWIINHKLIGWNETMITYLLAIASPSHGVPGSMYYSGWASQEKEAQEYRKNWGQTSDGSMYTNGNTYFGEKLDVGVSNGGPLFFIHYSFLGYDPSHITDRYTNYFYNNQQIAVINYKYCRENPGKFTGYSDSCWGLTACDGPYHYSASEPVPWQDDGKMAPTGALASFPYTPGSSRKALLNYYFNYGKFLWGEYGFRDAFNLSQNWCSEIYMGLNQAPVTVMIENYRSGLLWKLFMSDPDVQNGLKKIK